MKLFDNVREINLWSTIKIRPLGVTLHISEMYTSCDFSFMLFFPANMQVNGLR